MPQTVHEVFAACAKRHGDRPALSSKLGGAYTTLTWRDYYAKTRLAARGMMKLGLAAGDGVALIGNNCPQWFIADMAAIFAGAIPAGIYATSSAEQCQYIADHADATLAVVDDAAQLAKFQAVRGQLPKLKAIVLMVGSHPDADVVAFEDLLQLGEEVADAALDERLAAQKPDDACTLIYTSGTTGSPKAVMITHENLTWTARAVADTVGLEAGDVIVSYLPLSHIAEQMVSLHGPMTVGAWVWFAESLEALGDTLREARPHLFLGVPRVWEKIQGKMESVGANGSGLKKKIAAWARRKGLQGGYAEQNGQPKPLLYGLADKLVFSKVRQQLGLDRCRLQVTSAAPIAKSTLEFFLSLGVPIYEVYGMSECSGPATISLPNKYRTGKAGFCLPGAELRIAEDGEVCMRGAHVFKGYFKDEAATAEALDADGWLHSGDIGEIDGEGFLQITDRKKDLLITAGGENVAPQLIEGLLKAIGPVNQVVVVGDRRRYLAALFTLDEDKVAAVAAAAGSAATTAAEAATCDKFAAWLDAQVAEVNGRLARVQTIKRWRILPDEFTIEGGELTPTMKVKRKVIREKYGDVIESLYS
jgi:long-subunit acyl-CoA synthetase (AMP-forming)